MQLQRQAQTNHKNEVCAHLGACQLFSSNLPDQFLAASDTPKVNQRGICRIILTLFDDLPDTSGVTQL